MYTYDPTSVSALKHSGSSDDKFTSTDTGGLSSDVSERQVLPLSSHQPSAKTTTPVVQQVFSLISDHFTVVGQAYDP